MKNGKRVKEIYLEGNEIDNDSIVEAAEMINKNYHINTIRLGYNEGGNLITDDGLMMLCELLKGNMSLKSLYLSYIEGITNKSVEALKTLVENSSITLVQLNETSISNKADIAPSLAVNRLKSKYSNVTFRFWLVIAIVFVFMRILLMKTQQQNRHLSNKHFTEISNTFLKFSCDFVTSIT